MVFFFSYPFFFLACFTFIFILLALSLSFAPSSRIVTKLFSFGVYMSASNTTRRMGNQASLGISFGLFFLYLLMKVAMGYLQSSWWNSLRLLALDDNSVWGRKLLYMYFKQRLWDLRLLACQITLKFRFIFLNLWLNHSVHTLYIRAITKATPQEDDSCYFITKQQEKRSKRALQ